jgi:hypothetical protein
MRFYSRALKLLLVLWLCVFSLVDFKLFPNLVMCIGQDGHVELEIAVNDHCGNDAQATPSDILALNPAEENHCGVCSDIPLLSDFAQTVSRKSIAVSNSEAELFSALPSIQTLPFFPRNFEKPQPLPLSPPLPTLISIRSVRLLV